MSEYSDMESWSDSDLDCETDRLCHYCKEELNSKKCSMCNCWEYDCHPTDPWACNGICECDSCDDYRSKFPFPFPPLRRNPLTASTLYDRSTVHELRRFVRDRGLKDPQPTGITRQHLYYRILRAADENSRFRFLDLPPEMRNNIYRKLLIFPRVESFDASNCHPAILKTSRMINTEATGILYSENVFEMAIMQNHTKDAEIKKSVRVHNQRFPITCNHNKFSSIPCGIDAYPEFLRRIEQFYIKVDFICLGEGYNWTHGAGYDFINTCLLTFSSFLMDGHQLKKLTVRFESKLAPSGKTYLDLWEYGRMLYPLRRLRDIKQVDVSGDLPKMMCKRLMKEMQQSSDAHSPHNTLRHWSVLVEEARARLLLMRHLHGSTCSCGACHDSYEPCFLDLEDALESLAAYEMYQGGSPGIQSSTQESNIQARLAGVKHCLYEADVAELKRKFDAFVKAEEKRRTLEKHGGAGILSDALDKWETVDDWDNEDGEMESEDDDWGYGDYTADDEEDLAT